MGKPNLGQAMPSNGAYSSDVSGVTDFKDAQNVFDIHNVYKPKETKNILKILSVNVRGIECSGRLDQIRDLLVKHLVSVAVITETETTHNIAETTNIDGFKVFCPPGTVTGPKDKEVGVILMIWS